MRHRNSGKSFSRRSNHRQAMFSNLAASLIKHEKIMTTLPKAKELRRTIEPMITRAKVDAVENRRIIFSRMRDKDAVAKLFNDLGKHYQSKPGGYLRVLKAGYREGDKAPMAIVQLVDRPTVTAVEEE